jgi:hypothetical protein
VKDGQVAKTKEQEDSRRGTYAVPSEETFSWEAFGAWSLVVLVGFSFVLLFLAIIYTLTTRDF